MDNLGLMHVLAPAQYVVDHCFYLYFFQVAIAFEKFLQVHVTTTQQQADLIELIRRFF
jgi:hypothetical protein